MRDMSRKGWNTKTTRTRVTNTGNSTRRRKRYSRRDTTETRTETRLAPGTSRHTSLESSNEGPMRRDMSHRSSNTTTARHTYMGSPNTSTESSKATNARHTSITGSKPGTTRYRSSWSPTSGPSNTPNSNTSSNASSNSRTTWYTSSMSSNTSPSAATQIPTMGYRSPGHSSRVGYPSAQNPGTRVQTGVRTLPTTHRTTPHVRPPQPR